MHLGTTVCKVQICVAILETLHSTHGKQNLDTETEKSEQTPFAQILCLSIKIPRSHVPQNTPKDITQNVPCNTSVLKYISKRSCGHCSHLGILHAIINVFV